MARQRRKRVKRKRKGARSTSALTSRLETAAPIRPEPSRPRTSPPPVYVLPPGESRYQRRSANLPSGIERFTGLGGDPEITVDLTEVESAEAIAEAG